ncbi:MAG: T9SS type A sorting domain-containing protein, partial [Bacteroidota bacterium]
LFFDLSHFMGEKIEYSIFDMKGRLLRAGSFDTNHLEEEEINVGDDDWVEGMYMIKIKPESQSQMIQRILFKNKN